MTDPLAGDRWRVIEGDAKSVVAMLPDGCVRCCVTSPPYWRQRDYGVAAQIGLEATPEEYVARLVEVFTEVRRVLAGDGTLWLNLGDCYANDGKWGGSSGGKHVAELHGQTGIGRRKVRTGLKPKDLIGIPWRVAFALQADGWWLRSDIIWSKPNPIPESVTDRPTRSHEYVFQLTKRGDYFYDADAARTPASPSTETRLAQDIEGQDGSARGNGGRKINGPMKAVRRAEKQRGHSRRHAGFNDRWDAMDRSQQMASGANLRSVWWIAPAQFDGVHFAVMPDRLARICVLSSSEPGDVVLDPFMGAGTTGAVALACGRRFIGVDLNPEYVAIARRRIAEAAAQGNLFAQPSRDRS